MTSNNTTYISFEKYNIYYTFQKEYKLFITIEYEDNKVLKLYTHKIITIIICTVLILGQW